MNLIKKTKVKVIKYVFCGFCVLAILFLSLELSKVNLSVPLQYSGDEVFNQSAIKGIMDNGWYLENKYLGAPSSGDLYKFPMADNLHFFIMKLMTIFTKNSAVVINLFFILGFFLTAFTSLYVFERFKFSYFLSLTGALLYTFMPYHMIRNVGHLFLASYYIVPLSILLILWIGKEEISFLKRDEKSKKIKLSINAKGWMSIAICVLTAMANIYYAFFACFLIVVSTIFETLNSKENTKKKLAIFGTGIFLVTLVILVMAINLIPNFVNEKSYKLNLENVHRDPFEAEYYGMKISQLILPTNNNKIDFLRSIKESVDQYPLTNENSRASIGMMATIGFFFLLLVLFLKNNVLKERSDILYKLSALNLSCILLATIGGFGSLLALFFAYIRCYNRISIFIAFLSIFALLCILEYIFSKKIFKKNYLLPYFLLITIVAFGMFDQATVTFDNRQLVEWYVQDSEFIKKVEASLPNNSMVFELPYICFPECRPMVRIDSYDQFKPYLHSKNIRWSAGTFKNTKEDLVRKEISSKSPVEVLKSLSDLGFSGLLIDTFGYEDKGEKITSDFENVLKKKPLVSDDDRYYFFKLSSN